MRPVVIVKDQVVIVLSPYPSTVLWLAWAPLLKNDSNKEPNTKVLQKLWVCSSWVPYGTSVGRPGLIHTVTYCKCKCEEILIPYLHVWMKIQLPLVNFQIALQLIWSRFSEQLKRHLHEWSVWVIERRVQLSVWPVAQIPSFPDGMTHFVNEIWVQLLSRVIAVVSLVSTDCSFDQPN